MFERSSSFTTSTSTLPPTTPSNISHIEPVSTVVFATHPLHISSPSAFAFHIPYTSSRPRQPYSKPYQLYVSTTTTSLTMVCTRSHAACAGPCTFLTGLPSSSARCYTHQQTTASTSSTTGPCHCRCSQPNTKAMGDQRPTKLAIVTGTMLYWKGLPR